MNNDNNSHNYSKIFITGGRNKVYIKSPNTNLDILNGENEIII